MPLEQFEEKRRKAIKYHNFAKNAGELLVVVALLVTASFIAEGKMLLDEWWYEAEANLGVQIPSMKEAAIARGDYKHEHNPFFDLLFHMIPEVPEDLDVAGAAPETSATVASRLGFIACLGLILIPFFVMSAYWGIRLDRLLDRAFCTCGHTMEYHLDNNGNFRKCNKEVKPEKKRTWRTAFTIYKCTCTEYCEDAQTKKHRTPVMTCSAIVIGLLITYHALRGILLMS